MKLYFVPTARTEIEDAVNYYDERQLGLGTEFRQEVERATNKIAVDPTNLPFYDRETRICRTHRFPYGVIFQVVGTEIWVLAVAHLHRMPGYWKKRD
jgi:hypothetical protein